MSGMGIRGKMMTSFEELGVGREIVRALTLLGMEQPTPVQEAVLPLAFLEKDILAQAQTGSGKTAAFAIPLCQMVSWEENRPQALVLVPTRELAMQVQEETASVGKFRRMKVPVLMGSHSFRQQERDLRQKAHIVIGTPGRVLDHLEQGTLATEAIRYVVLDEADEMLELGFLEQVEEILVQLPKERVTWLFSATLPEKVKRLASHYLKQPEEIKIAGEPITTQRIEQTYYDATDWDKVELLQGILTVLNPDSCLIFANTREMVDELCDELLEYEFSCDRLHGGMEQAERTQVMQDFRRGDFRYLVATDVAARGIDIAQISLVVNYELPDRQENYIHRIGRTGRAGQEGQAIALVEQSEMENLRQLERLMGVQIPQAVEPTLEEVEAAKPAFLHKMRLSAPRRLKKSDAFAQEIMKLRIDAGKKGKIRPVDIVGTLCAIAGMTAEDIGVISIFDWSSYVEILNGKGPLVLEALQTKPLKGQLRQVTKAEW